MAHSPKISLIGDILDRKLDELWKLSLLRDNRREQRPYKGNLANVRLALISCEEIRGIVQYDEFSQTILRAASTPWCKDLGPWDDIDDLRLTEFLQRQDLNVVPETVRQAVLIEARDRAFHSVRDYLNSAVWDGTPRCGTWLSTYLGVNDDPYSRAVGRKFMISAVARGFVPGCKVDTMLVLEGEQGIGKSTALRILFGDCRFSDQMFDLASKEASIQLQGKWCIELSELDAMRKAEITSIKAFLSRSFDRFRPLYAKAANDFPRQCVITGTTNSDDWLRDASGGRRFWPVHCTRVDREALCRDRDQLWAEALALFQAGEQWHLTAEEETYAVAEQSQRYAEDPWARFIDLYVWIRKRVTIEEILTESAINLRPGQVDALARRRVADYLRRWGFERKRSGSSRYYLRPAQIPREKWEFVAKVQSHPNWDAQGISSNVLPFESDDAA